MATINKKPVRRKKETSKIETPIVLTKEELAKQKVEELLGDMEITTKPKKEEIPVDLLVESTKGKSVDWLEKQVAGLTETNKKLTEDYNKLVNEVNGTAPTGEVVVLKQGIEKLFFELDGVLTGEKFGKAYPEAKIRPLLNKFMAIFPFLGESLKKKKTKTQAPRGQGQQVIAHSGQGQQRAPQSGPQNMQRFR